MTAALPQLKNLKKKSIFQKKSVGNNFVLVVCFTHRKCDKFKDFTFLAVYSSNNCKTLLVSQRNISWSKNLNEMNTEKKYDFNSDNESNTITLFDLINAALVSIKYFFLFHLIHCLINCKHISISLFYILSNAQQLNFSITCFYLRCWVT